MLKRITLTLMGLGLLFALGFGAMTAGWLLGFGPASTSPSVSAKGELRLFGTEPQTLDPALAADADSARYLVEIFSGLVTLDKDLQIIPDIAQKWDISPDGRTYTFHLRSDVTFHDGRSVTAQDFKYALERAASPTTGSTSADTYLGDIVGVREKLQGKASTISGVKAVDNATLQIEIDAPKAYFLAKLTYPVAFVVDKANVESGRNWAEHPNGTGSFILKEWRHRERLVLERYGGFYRGPPQLSRVTFLMTGGVPLTMYENGEVDITYVGPGDIERVTDPRNPLSKELVTTSELSVNYIGFNTAVPPFDDPKVRQALTYAVDRERVMELTLKGLYPAAKGILPPGTPGYYQDLKGLEYNPQKAKDLIAQSKYGSVANLPPIIYSVSGTGAGVPHWDRAMLDMWRTNLGLSVQTQEISPPDYYQEVDQGSLQMFSLGWIADYPDPQNFLDVLFHSRSQSNNTHYSNPQVDELLERARVEQNQTIRFQLYRQAEEIIVNDAPWLPLWYSVSRQLVKPYVKGYNLAPIIIPTFREVYIGG